MTASHNWKTRRRLLAIRTSPERNCNCNDSNCDTSRRTGYTNIEHQQLRAVRYLIADGI
jgi:hypothetical protein